jgi:antitoxin (DNA-binding transcriptional repressor) of toxin-antitoxin stability system
MTGNHTRGPGQHTAPSYRAPHRPLASPTYQLLPLSREVRDSGVLYDLGMTAASIGPAEPDDTTELSLTDARNRLPELTETTIRDGGIVYLTRYGRRVAAIVPADIAENYERMEDAYLSALADEAKTDTEAPLSTAELIKELGLA